MQFNSWTNSWTFTRVVLNPGPCKSPYNAYFLCFSYCFKGLFQSTVSALLSGHYRIFCHNSKVCSIQGVMRARWACAEKREPVNLNLIPSLRSQEFQRGSGQLVVNSLVKLFHNLSQINHDIVILEYDQGTYNLPTRLFKNEKNYTLYQLGLKELLPKE